MPNVVEVILPLPVKSNYHYKIPEFFEGEVEIGMRVMVVFGKRKIYTGVIKGLVQENDPHRLNQLKYLDEIIDKQPVITKEQLKLFNWIAFYYFCTEGEVLKAALPAGLKPESTLRIEAKEGFKWDHLDLGDKEFILLEALEVQSSLTLQEVSNIWGVQDPGTRLRNMEARGLLNLVHRVEEKYKPKLETLIELAEAYREESQMHEALDALSRAAKQQEAMMLVIQSFLRNERLSKAELVKRISGSSAAVSALVKKGILNEVKVKADRLEELAYDFKSSDFDLTTEQKNALQYIRTSFSQDPQKPVLLHGVTGSGKTAIYIDLIQEVLDKGRRVLYLLPEIALTKQIIDRVKSAFGEKVGVYHSRFTDNERVEIWEKVLKREYEVVIGVRSAIFLPFDDLELIVVDEEHDPSFKQQEPNPRYNARDLAVFSAGLLNCHVLLGSATPSFESYRNALQNKYGFFEILTRATQAKLPEIMVVDMKDETRRKLNKGYFSSMLFTEINGIHKRGEQGILFQNRRGYSPFLICNVCGNVPKCVNCDVTLVFHKHNQQLRCHYCGYSDYQVSKCDACGNFEMRQQGLGTERLEENAKEHFPDMKIERMDLDTTRGKFGYRNIIRRLEAHEIDLLVGTQMVTKGLDFPNVTLVGVPDTDTLLNFSDFRAYERAFQLLTQVSGRAGRSELKGRVVMQSRMPDNVVLRQLQKPYREFYEKEITARFELNYPPFSRLIQIETRHKDPTFLEKESLSLMRLLQVYFGSYLLGPAFPPVARLRNIYRMHFMLKLPKNLSVKAVRSGLADSINKYYEKAEPKTMRIVVDVDPM